MLVYHNLPFSYGRVAGKRVHGFLLNRPPTKISYDEYLKNKSFLVPAPYTKEYIENITGREFPLDISFTIDTLKNLEYRTLQKMATFFEVKAVQPRTNLIYAVRSAVRDL